MAAPFDSDCSASFEAFRVPRTLRDFGHSPRITDASGSAAGSCAGDPDVRTVLIMLWPEYGAFNASLPLAKRLRNNAFDPVYCGPVTFEAYIRDQGFEYLAFPDHSTSDLGNCGSGLAGWFRRKTAHYRALSDQRNDRLAQLTNWLMARRLALALVDPLMWGLLPPLLGSGVPILNLNTMLCSPWTAAYPPVFSDIVPAVPPSTLACFWSAGAWFALCWIRALKYEWVDNFWYLLARTASNRNSRRAKALIHSSGGKLCFGEFGPRLVAPELMLSPSDFDFPEAAQRPGRCYVGACVDPDRRESSFSWATLRPDKPLLYCSLGTYSHMYPHSRRLFHAVVSAIKDNENWQAIVQIGSTGLPHDFGPIPPHILIVNKVPQIAILKRSSIFVTHAGFSSIRESLYCGVPMIAFPCWLDQPGNAARVVYHNVGVRGNISSITPSGITTLMRAVQDSGIRAAVHSMQRRFVMQESCQAGVDQILKIFSGRERASTGRKP